MNSFKILSSFAPFTFNMGIFFCQEENKKVALYHGQIRITDLSEALKSGGTCQTYSLDFMESVDDDICTLINWYRQNFSSLNELYSFLVEQFKGVEKNEVDLLLATGESFKAYRSEKKGVRVFSPFALERIKPLTGLPKKWNLQSAIKALINGQFKDLRCKGHYTDDYAFDAAYNFQKGPVADHILFAADIQESPSGWWTTLNENNVVSICCHHFKSYEFILDMEAGQETERPEPESETKEVEPKQEKPAPKKLTRDDVRAFCKEATQKGCKLEKFFEPNVKRTPEEQRGSTIYLYKGMSLSEMMKEIARASKSFDQEQEAKYYKELIKENCTLSPEEVKAAHFKKRRKRKAVKA
jgi:hypothetical protein